VLPQFVYRIFTQKIPIASGFCGFWFISLHRSAIVSGQIRITCNNFYYTSCSVFALFQLLMFQFLEHLHGSHINIDDHSLLDMAMFEVTFLRWWGLYRWCHLDCIHIYNIVSYITTIGGLCIIFHNWKLITDAKRILHPIDTASEYVGCWWALMLTGRRNHLRGAADFRHSSFCTRNRI